MIINIIIGLIIVYVLWNALTPKVNRKAKINIELVPYEAQGFNVRSRVSKEQWEAICRVVHKKATPRGKFKCEQCGMDGIQQGFKHPVECHEVWEFNESARTQTLVGMVSICPMCHKAKHIGLAEKMGFGDRVRKHMAKFNRWKPQQVENYIQSCFMIVKQKSGRHYKLDLTYLNRREFSFLKTKFTNDEANNCDVQINY